MQWPSDFLKSEDSKILSKSAKLYFTDAIVSKSAKIYFTDAIVSKSANYILQMRLCQNQPNYILQMRLCQNQPNFFFQMRWPDGHWPEEGSWPLPSFPPSPSPSSNPPLSQVGGRQLLLNSWVIFVRNVQCSLSIFVKGIVKRFSITISFYDHLSKEHPDIFLWLANDDPLPSAKCRIKSPVKCDAEKSMQQKYKKSAEKSMQQ